MSISYIGTIKQYNTKINVEKKTEMDATVHDENTTAISKQSDKIFTIIGIACSVFPTTEVDFGSRHEG